MKTRIALLSLAMTLLACEAKPAAPEAPPSPKAQVIDDPLRHFQAQRLQRMIDEELPAALADKNDGAVRRICDLGERTIDDLKTPPALGALEAVIPKFQRFCSVDVSSQMLSRTTNMIAALDEADRGQRCEQNAALVVTFSLNHDQNDPGVDAHREALLELCPKLASKLEAFEAQRREHLKKSK